MQHDSLHAAGTKFIEIHHQEGERVRSVVFFDESGRALQPLLFGAKADKLQTALGTDVQRFSESCQQPCCFQDDRNSSGVVVGSWGVGRGVVMGAQDQAFPRSRVSLNIPTDVTGVRLELTGLDVDFDVGPCSSAASSGWKTRRVIACSAVKM